jgi:hypothetical protein
MPAAAWLEPMPALLRSNSKTSARPASLKAMPSPTMPAPMIATRGRLAIEGPAIAGKDETLALNAAPFAGMTQTEVPYVSMVKDLECQSTITARIERKGLFCALSKRTSGRVCISHSDPKRTFGSPSYRSPSWARFCSFKDVSLIVPSIISATHSQVVPCRTIASHSISPNSSRMTLAPTVSPPIGIWRGAITIVRGPSRRFMST